MTTLDPARIDVVIVSYNSRGVLRNCVAELTTRSDVSVVVVDNASSDESLESVADLPVTCIGNDQNRGFGHGCNVGWRGGSAPYVLFLNPDASLDPPSLDRLVAILEAERGVGIAVPRTVGPDGELHYSLRRFARLRSTYARALFLHRIFPRAAWTDELIRDTEHYASAGSPEWASGACLLVRRHLLDTIGGFDERFFLYREDMDLCRRARNAGYDIRFEPSATAVHVGGASAPRPSLFPVLAESRILYAQKHRGRLAASLERWGIALEALTHTLLARGGRPVRAGHVRSLRVVTRAKRSPSRMARSS